jgi:hypothetical protein
MHKKHYTSNRIYTIRIRKQNVRWFWFSEDFISGAFLVIDIANLRPITNKIISEILTKIGTEDKLDDDNTEDKYFDGLQFELNETIGKMWGIATIGNDVEVTAHECLHTVEDLGKYLGIDNEEFKALVCGVLTKKILEKFKKHDEARAEKLGKRKASRLPSVRRKQAERKKDNRKL